MFRVWNRPALKALCRSIELDKIEGQSPLTVAFRYGVSLAPLTGLRFLDDAELQQFVDLLLAFQQIGAEEGD